MDIHFDQVIRIDNNIKLDFQDQLRKVLTNNCVTSDMDFSNKISHAAYIL